MEYIASVRVGLNDIKALVNLESDRRSAVAPLLNMRGNDSRYIDSFLSHWTDHPFFIDVSTSRVDAADSFLVEHGLLSAANAYAARRRRRLWRNQPNRSDGIYIRNASASVCKLLC